VQIAVQQIQDQTRVYRGVYERHFQDPDAVGFGDVVTAQQTLATYIANYITALGLQWTAVVDMANLLQTENLYEGSDTQEMTPVPDLECLAPPSCERLVSLRQRPVLAAPAAAAGTREITAGER
jgi:outer membrane protein, heavy metal efflux system